MSSPYEVYSVKGKTLKTGYQMKRMTSLSFILVKYSYKQFYLIVKQV